MADELGGRLRQAAHLGAILLLASVASIPTLLALPTMLRGDAAWIDLAPAFASMLACILVPVFLALPGRGTALLTYAAIAALPAVIGAAAGRASPLAELLAFAASTLALGALLAAWGFAARRAAAERALALYA